MLLVGFHLGFEFVEGVKYRKSLKMSNCSSMVPISCKKGTMQLRPSNLFRLYLVGLGGLLSGGWRPLGLQPPLHHEGLAVFQFMCKGNLVEDPKP